MPETGPSALVTALARVARVPRLLVASDFDGVLSPIVARPELAAPLPEAGPVLLFLADLPGTTVALVSGRSRADLARRSRMGPPVMLVGSHGVEVDGGTLVPVGEAERERHRRLREALAEITADRPGVSLEVKPISVAVHTRNAPRPVAAEVVGRVRRGPATWPGVHVTTGKEVVELAVTETGKGRVVELLRRRVGADAVVYLGDDVTDEDAFAVLQPADVGVKVGPGPTRAGFRVDSPVDAVRLLARLAALRRPAGG